MGEALMDPTLVTRRVLAVVSERQGVAHHGTQLGVVRVPVLVAPGACEDMAVVALDRDLPGELRLVPISRVSPAR